MLRRVWLCQKYILAKKFHSSVHHHHYCQLLTQTTFWEVKYKSCCFCYFYDKVGQCCRQHDRKTTFAAKRFWYFWAYVQKSSLCLLFQHSNKQATKYYFPHNFYRFYKKLATLATLISLIDFKYSQGSPNWEILISYVNLRWVLRSPQIIQEIKKCKYAKVFLAKTWVWSTESRAKSIVS